MEKIGLFEAKMHLSEIAARVRRTGKGVTLTKWGAPLVDLVPHKESGAGKRPQAEVISDLDQLRRKLPKESFDRIKTDIEVGRC